MKKSIRRFCTHTLCVLLAASVAIPAWGAPADITASPAPTIGADPPKAREIKDGDASVSTQTGALQYSYPITVPPGRNGAQPSLALTYSSQAAVYGGIASGWSLSVPEIQLDTSVSVMEQLWNSPTGGSHFISTLSGSRPLIGVTEPRGTDTQAAYRAQNDSSYIRYERMKPDSPYLWRARSPDGTTYYFGDTSLSWGWGQPLRVPLTRTVDKFGNTVEYRWAGTELMFVRYTSNPDAGLPAFARVDFEYTAEQCGTHLPIGAAEDRRTMSSEGMGKLTKIRATALDPATGTTQHTREYTLGYDANASRCDGRHGPLRMLSSIQESAWGQTSPRVDLPPVTFEYNRLERTFDQVTNERLAAWPPENLPSNHVIRPSSGSGQRTSAGWPSVTSMLLDFDGDSLVDRITLAPDPNECMFQWQRNLGRGPDGTIQFDVPSAPQRMPRLPWKGAQKGYGEACSLNHQVTMFQTVAEVAGCRDNPGSYLAYRWMDLTGDGKVDLVAAIHYGFFFNPDLATSPDFFAGLRISPWSDCASPLPPGPCHVPSGVCMASAEVCAEDGCFLESKATARCLEASEPRVCEDLAREMDQYGEHDPDQNEVGPSWPPGTRPPGKQCDYKRPYQRCNHNPWFLYENKGAYFAGEGVVKYQPIPLESDTGDSSIGGVSGFASQGHAIQDMDGDGTLDAVVRGRVAQGSGVPNFWIVYLGDGTGGFRENPRLPYIMYVPRGAKIEGGCTTSLPLGGCGDPALGSSEFDTKALSLLADLNGDGATDYTWMRSPQRGPEVYFGDGRRFRNWSIDPPVGDRLGTKISLLSRGHAHANAQIPWGANAGWLLHGWRRSAARLLDIDGDGRLDLLHSAPSSYPNWSPATLHMNAGGDFLDGIPTAGSPLEEALVQHTTAFDLQGDYWATQRDLIDMDGDGLPEHWNFLASSASGIPTMRDQSDQPLRLLRQVRNGIGGTVDISYAATTNAAVVTQSASDGKAMPHSQWVVRSMAVRDQWDMDVSTTTYKYDYPVWNRDERNRWGFRGFEEVTTTRPSGARVVDTYGFDVDWSGRLTMSRTYSAEDTAGPRTISETRWDAFQLFGGAITTYHSGLTHDRTCGNGQTESQCRASTYGVVRTTSWGAVGSTVVSGGPPLAYVALANSVRDGASYAAGDTTTWEEYYFYADEDDYRLEHKEHTAYEMTPAGAWKVYRKTQTLFDALVRAPVATVEWASDDWSSPTSRIVTGWDVDSLTGVTRGKQSPNNYPSGPWERYEHDPTKRFVTRTINEVQHVVDTTYDAGTGAVLTRRGPTTSACGAGCNAPMSWTDVDGLGRPLASWVAVAVPGNPAWQKTLVARTSYTDQIVGGQPTRVMSESRIEYDQDRWTREETRLDGQARPREVRVRTGLGADAVTSYDYDHRGNLVTVGLPDPSWTGTAPGPAQSVAYTYGFDSLGRPIWIRRPSMTGSASGFDMTYDRNVSQVDEITGGEGGVAGRKVLVNDVFGRLSEVRELTGMPGAPYASTFYTYDARDTVTHIQNPDGVVTDLLHDLLGRRERIVRAGRTWSYTYDKNGNIKTEAAPPPSPSQALAYTTSYAYDTAGRLTSRSVGGRELSAPDQALLGVGTISFTHDACTNGTGRLCSVTHPNGVLGVSYEYDPEGNPIRESRTFGFAGLSETRSMTTTYGPGGRVREHTYADNQTGQTNASRSRVAYDDRAMPVEMWWQPAGQTPQLVAAQTRNVSGLVTRREARNPIDPTMPEFESVFTYDRLSRVRSQTVRDLPSTLLAQQELDYYGSDDPAHLRHWLGSEYFDFDFQYDPRHQLIGAKEAQAKFNANYTFTTSGKLQTALVNAVPAPGSDVVSRDVTYKYGSSIDPEAVSALTPNAGGAPLRTYSYDTAGNMVTRNGGASEETFAYDGEDQFRRAVVGDLREEYYYDHGGRRTAVVTRDANNVVQTVRVFFGDTELIFNGTGQLTTTLANISLGTPVARVTDRTSIEFQYHGLSSNTLVSVAPNGTVKSGFVYGPYGELLLTSGASVPKQQRRFNDKVRDDLTALSYYGARYYDGVLMGWTQADPKYRVAPDAAWIEPRRAMLYAFSLANPVRYMDPDGRDAREKFDTALRIGALLNPGGLLAHTLLYTEITEDPEHALQETALNMIPGHAGDAVGIVQGAAKIRSGNAVIGIAIILATLAPAGADKLLKSEVRNLADGTVTKTAQELKDSVHAVAGPGPSSRVPTSAERGDDAVQEAAGTARVLGDRMKEATSLDGALDQLNGITKAQREARAAGIPDKINSISKSKGNAFDRIKRIRSAKDYDDQDID